jgi:long-chain fatty acid transport protein
MKQLKEQTMSKANRQPLSWVAAAGVTLAASTAGAAGFQINEHNAAATGRASAVVATIDDASAIWHNPAGLANIEGTEVQVGASFIRPRGEYVGPGLASTNPNFPNEVTAGAVSRIVPVPNAYVSHALSKKAVVGVGFYAPYGLGIEWQNKDSWVGRTSIQELSLRSFFITPAIALKLSDAVNVAVAVSLVPATVYLQRTLGATDNGQVLFPSNVYGSEGTLEVSGSAFGVGASFGVQAKLIDHLRLGAVFRSAVDLGFSGNANFNIPSTATTEVRANFPDQTGRADLTLPHTLGFGVGWVDGALTLEAATQITFWTSYDELRLNFDAGRPAPSSASPRDWKTVPMFRLGAQYMLDKLALRAGLAYDLSPAPDDTVDPTLPDNDRLIGTLGAGYSFGPVRVDLAYMGIAVKERTIAAGVNRNFAEGTYSGGIVNVLSTTVGVRL